MTKMMKMMKVKMMKMTKMIWDEYLDDFLRKTLRRRSREKKKNSKGEKRERERERDRERERVVDGRFFVSPFSPAQWAPSQLNGPVQASLCIFVPNLLTGPPWPTGSWNKKFQTGRQPGTYNNCKGIEVSPFANESWSENRNQSDVLLETFWISTKSRVTEKKMAVARSIPVWLWVLAFHPNIRSKTGSVSVVFCDCSTGKHPRNSCLMDLKLATHDFTFWTCLISWNFMRNILHTYILHIQYLKHMFGCILMNLLAGCSKEFMESEPLAAFNFFFTFRPFFSQTRASWKGTLRRELREPASSWKPWSLASYTWSATGWSSNWCSAAISDDGKIVGTIYGSNIYISSDGGSAWTALASSKNWVDVDMSLKGPSAVMVTAARAAVSSLAQHHLSCGIVCLLHFCRNRQFESWL